MPAAINLTGLAITDPVPGVYLQVNFAQGPASGNGGVRTALLLGNKTTAGTATADTVIYGPDTPLPCQTESDVINLFGAGSEIHRMFRRWIEKNQTTPLYMIAVAVSGGTAATGTITVSGTSTANGNARVWIGDEFVDTAIQSGQTGTQIAMAIIANINAVTRWPVTATQATGVITLTAKIAGARGNDIAYMAAITQGITTTVTATTDSFLTGGTTADSNVNALATIDASKYYYIVSAAHDATQFGALASQVATQALPTTGIRQRCFCGSIDTLANTITLSTGVNNPRAEIVWLQTSDWTPAEMAADAAAIYAALEGSGAKPRHNFSNFPSSASDATLWTLPAPRTPANFPLRTSFVSSLNNGITPIGVNATGTTFLVKRITSYSLTLSQNDYRIRDAHKVTECDFYADDLQAKYVLQFGGKDLSDDPVQGNPVPDGQVATPGAVKGATNRLTQDYADTLRMKNVAEILAGTVVQRESQNPNRLSIRIPLQPIDILDQLAGELDQVA